jgi:outer membrane protein TolC
MRILVIVLALVLVSVVVLPSNPPTPSAATVWNLKPFEMIEDSDYGPVKVTFYPLSQSSRLPKVPKPGGGDPEPDLPWNLTLTDAIRIGLEHSATLRTSPWSGATGGVGLAIEPIDGQESLWEFQARAMTLVRSIEAAYATLWQEHRILQARETARDQVRDLLSRERDRSNSDRIAEIEKRYENFQIDLVSTTSDVITTERQLRNILGLPPADGRRIIPITPPIEAKVAPDWASSLLEMNASQPDLFHRKLMARLNELQLLLARNQLVPKLTLTESHQFQALGNAKSEEPSIVAGIDITTILVNTATAAAADWLVTPRDWNETASKQVSLSFGFISCFRGPLPNVRQAQYQLIRQRAAFEAATRQATDALARSFGEIATSYGQFTLDRQEAIAATLNREDNQGDFEPGRISAIERIDIIAREVNAIADDARSLATYHASIIAFEEAKGTLLDFEGIGLVATPKDPAITQALASIPSELPDGSHGLRLIQEGPACSPISIDDRRNLRYRSGSE